MTQTVSVKLPLLKSGAVGNAMKNAQELLIRHGYACDGRIIASRENPDWEFGADNGESCESIPEPEEA